MAKLFFIGNGFDVAHGLKTQYWYFRRTLQAYFRCVYPGIDLDNFDDVPEIWEKPNGGTGYDEKQSSVMLWNLIDEACTCGDWSDFEDALGRLDYGRIMDKKMGWLHGSILEKENPWHQVNNNQDAAAPLYQPIMDIQKHFTNWINRLRTGKSKVNPSFLAMINPAADYFFNFNYTDTLQRLYHAQNVNHIHGQIANGASLTFGHNSDKEVSLHVDYTGAEEEFGKVKRSLRKPTKAIIEDNMDYFISLGKAGIQEIYSYGFSHSSVDEPYIAAVCRHVDTSRVRWFLHQYDHARHGEFKSCIRRNGFKGAFDTFSC